MSKSQWMKENLKPGEIYAGIILGQGDEPDYHLILAPAEQEMIGINWSAAVEKASQPYNGFSDWSLPTRREARLLAINSPEGFDKDGWYWTSEQDAFYSDAAWLHDFPGGYQYCHHKSHEYRARAVRRILIIQ